MRTPEETAANLAAALDKSPGGREGYVRDNLGAKVRRALGRVAFLREAMAAYYCARDPNTPTRVKAAVLAALAYFIMPADVIPDLIAVLGYTDDATVFWAAYRFVRPYITQAHRDKAAGYLGAVKTDPAVPPD